ncbi:exodeoxyribonuclease VII small subunit [Clostridium moniliforme]|uniref:Exodeoxyribonuclease 7 small subunit n=1 Tax=Clostridium moniliforme TaxID=39489 RepID=A0ABS4F0J5_9CLOT|nr:exodeoxyribonuclease VII small subunit [Clostridium moniliforme]MBP1889762.1 exodeoxyribonuclease VII small subunit [Clostridium moniliforme]
MARKVSYEDMLQNLKNILEKLEENELSLEEAMKEYEKGIKLVNKLYKTLNDYEGKISIVKNEEEVEFEGGSDEY